MNMRTAMALAVMLSASALMLTWRQSLPPPPEVHVVVLRDRSGSNGSPCASVVALLSRALDEISTSRHASVMLLMTGDAASADEPVEVPLPAPPRPSRKSINPRDHDAVRHDAYLRLARTRCEQIETARRSPIYQAIARLIDHLRRAGDDGSVRRGYIQSDLEELANPAIREALRAPPAGKPVARLPMLDNTGINLFFCGLAETLGTQQVADGPAVRFTRPRRQDGGERQRAVWATMFSDPNRVTFAPFCPRWHDESPSTSSGAAAGGPSPTPMPD